MTEAKYWEKRCVLAEKLLDHFLKEYLKDHDRNQLERGLATADLLVYSEHRHMILNEVRKEHL